MSNEITCEDWVIVAGSEFMYCNQRYIGRKGRVFSQYQPTQDLLRIWKGPPGKWWTVAVTIKVEGQDRVLKDCFHEAELIKICK